MSGTHLHNQTDSAALVVIGGGVVEIDGAGAPFAKAPIAAYLHDLADAFGTIHFFAFTTPKRGELFETPLDTERVKLHALRFPLARGASARARAFFSDLRAFRRSVPGAFAVVEFHPAAGGWLASLLLKILASRYALYFGMDPRKRWTPLTGGGALNTLKRLFLLLSGEFTGSLADLVLVRDAGQLKRLARRKRGRAYLSSPLSGAVEATAERDDTCLGETIRLLFVGMLDRRKGIEDMLQAVAHLRDERSLDGRHVHLTLAGGSPGTSNGPGTIDGRYTVEEVRRIAADLGVEAHVTLTGYIDDMDKLSRLYNEADIFVLASRAEGFPRVLDEASAYGLPIVTTSLPEIRATLQDRTEALMTEPAQPRELAARILEVIGDGELRRTLIAGARSVAARRLTEKASAQHTRLLLALAEPRAESVPLGSASATSKGRP